MKFTPFLLRGTLTSRALILPLSILISLALTGCETAMTGSSFEPAADIVVEPAAAPSAHKERGSIPRPAPLGAKAGVITAGDVDDTLNLRSFTRYQSQAAKALDLPRANLARPVLVRLKNQDGKTLQGTRVTLRKKGGRVFYDGYAGVDGLVSVFPAVLGAGAPKEIELRAFDQSGDAVAKTIKTSSTLQEVTLNMNATWQPKFLDLAFVIDTTGSMADELDWITKDLRGIIRKARQSAPGVDIRLGLVVYRDHGDAYVVRNYGFTKSQSQMQKWLRNQSASGGGDYPEAAAAALAAGAALDWRRGKGERLMFHIADAPPHDRDARAYLAAAQVAAKKNVQIFGLGASGVAAESEFLMRQAAVQTSGRYLFLTDDSGVGHAHAEPTIACYRVTQLSNLMVRVLRSELSGKRVEAPASSVIREVGSYVKGVCRS